MNMEAVTCPQTLVFTYQTKGNLVPEKAIFLVTAGVASKLT
jgi:hypothetical protein